MASAAATYLGSCLLTEWDARNIGVSNGAAISTWPKSAASTEGNDLTQGTALRQPTYRTGTYPYAEFDGTNDVMAANLVSDPEVVFLVCELTSDATLRAFCSMLSGGNYVWAYIASGAFTNAFVGTTPSISPSVTWNSAQNATKQVIAIMAKSTSGGFLMNRSGAQNYLTAKPSFAGQFTLGGFNNSITYPFSGKMYYAATATGLSFEKIRHAMAVIAQEWGATFDSPESAGSASKPQHPMYQQVIR